MGNGRLIHPCWQVSRSMAERLSVKGRHGRSRDRDESANSVTREIQENRLAGWLVANKVFHLLECGYGTTVHGKDEIRGLDPGIGGRTTWCHHQHGDSRTGRAWPKGDADP